MTDTLAALRAGCQRGEMPTWYKFLDVVTIANIQSKTAPLDIYEPEKGRYLDALHALQQARWPGSVICVACKADGAQMVIILADPANVETCDMMEGEFCPTLATAWLDAILAGLQQENGGRDG